MQSYLIPSLILRPHNVRKAVLDLAFNLGRDKLNTFKKMRKALENDDYNTAAAEMKDSKWFDQVKTRGSSYGRYNAESRW